jgi:rubrerythrin
MRIVGRRFRGQDAAAGRRFVLQVVQPGLAGLMDGSVSTLAPLFAAAFATRTSRAAFLVGLAAAIGAGIMATPFLTATFQVVLGGVLVFLTGMLIGGA